MLSLKILRLLKFSIIEAVTMVFFFVSSDRYTIYMGVDKYENEDLIKYGLSEDVW